VAWPRFRLPSLPNNAARRRRSNSSRSAFTDHTAANTELQQIAKQADVSLPAQPTGKDAAEGQKLRGVTGTAFDQAYAQGQLQDHRETVELFQKEASSGQDPALKAFAQKTLPILQQHLQMAEALNTKR
jgi:putative membrane protein